jgi:hypothetical protein
MTTKSNQSPCRAAGDIPSQFCRDLVFALGKLKGRLREKFEKSYPGSGHLIRQALSEAEELAWETSFPHLFLPDFAEVRLARIMTARERAFARAA